MHNDIKQLSKILEDLFRLMVDHPEYVEVEVTTLGKQAGEVFVKTKQEDLKHVVGRNGKNAEAIRTLIKCVAAKNKIRLYLTIDKGDE